MKDWQALMVSMGIGIAIRYIFLHQDRKRVAKYLSENVDTSREQKINTFKEVYQVSKKKAEQYF